ncbi:hypothetical protein [Prosthecobacter sp.]|jgi:hypothetical protein|uniref:hypothetical protein n=1 Tax=Prosthecobacter sp. TaxID=1965333 RepID=UPI00378347BB
MNIHIRLRQICLLTAFFTSATVINAQGLAAQTLTLADAKINQVLKGDPSILNSLNGKIVVALWTPDYVDTTPQPADPPSNWKGSRAAWARYRADYPKSRENDIKRKSDVVKAFESLRRKYKDQPNVVFLGLAMSSTNKGNVDQTVEQLKMTFPIAKPADDGQLPSRHASHVIIYDASGKAVHTGPVDNHSESFLRKTVKP